jgi:hypothetical protein
VWNNTTGKWEASILPWASINTATTAVFSPTTFGEARGVQVVLPSNANNVTKGIGVTKLVLQSNTEAFCILGNVTGIADRFVPAIAGRPSGNPSGSFFIQAYEHETPDTGASSTGALSFFVRQGLPSSFQPIANSNIAITFYNDTIQLGRVTGEGRWTFPANISSDNTTSGTVVVAGGVGIGGELNVGGQINGLGAVQPGTPASAAATGTAGQIRWDADYIYVCTAGGNPGTWKRVAISTW